MNTCSGTLHGDLHTKGIMRLEKLLIKIYIIFDCTWLKHVPEHVFKHSKFLVAERRYIMRKNWLGSSFAQGLSSVFCKWKPAIGWLLLKWSLQIRWNLLLFFRQTNTGSYCLQVPVEILVPILLRHYHFGRNVLTNFNYQILINVSL